MQSKRKIMPPPIRSGCLARQVSPGCGPPDRSRRSALLVAQPSHRYRRPGCGWHPQPRRRISCRRLAGPCARLRIISTICPTCAAGQTISIRTDFGRRAMECGPCRAPHDSAIRCHYHTGLRILAARVPELVQSKDRIIQHVRLYECNDTLHGMLLLQSCCFRSTRSSIQT